MALFTRRALQRLINENRRFLTPSQISRQVKILNDPDPSQDWIATEWEIAVLNVFAQLGSVAHELGSPGTTRPDIRFTPKGDALPVVFDIATVSDRGLHSENPIEHLLNDLTRRTEKVRQRGIKGGFILSVGETSRAFRGSDPMHLKLPRPGEFKREVFNQHFSTFLEKIADQPDETHGYLVRNERIDLNIRYSPQHPGVALSSYPAYTAPHSLTRNPIANALKKKGSQLKRSKFQCLRGIILCDGGCHMLNRFADWSSYSLTEVILHFFRDHSSIGLVLIIGVWPDQLRAWSASAVHVEGKLYVNPSGAELPQKLRTCLERVPTLFPKPAHTAVNARLSLDWHRKVNLWNEGDSFFGGLAMDGKRVRISARTILELLAGRLDHARFLKAHDFDRLNPFANGLKQGRLIVSAQIERSGDPEEDDEWLVLEFGDPDPAISPYR